MPRDALRWAAVAPVSPGFTNYDLVSRVVLCRPLCTSRLDGSIYHTFDVFDFKINHPLDHTSLVSLSSPVRARALGSSKFP